MNLIIWSYRSRFYAEEEVLRAAVGRATFIPDGDLGSARPVPSYESGPLLPSSVHTHDRARHLSTVIVSESVEGLSLGFLAQVRKTPGNKDGFVCEVIVLA